MGEYAGWTIDTYQWAEIKDLLRVLIWYQTEDATKKTPKHFPEPSWRPGTKSTEATPDRPKLTREEARAALDRIRDGGDDVSVSRSPRKRSARHKSDPVQ